MLPGSNPERSSRHLEVLVDLRERVDAEARGHALLDLEKHGERTLADII